MRKYGYIGEVYFSCQGFSIRHLAYEYRLVFNEGSTCAYVNSMAELKSAISELLGE